MNAKAVPSESGGFDATHETANDRFKSSFGNWFWGSMIAATVLHFAVFQFWPDMTADDFSFTRDQLEMIDLPPEIEIPPPPEQIARPATPVIAETEIDEDITIAPTTFEDNPPEDLPPPPEGETTDISAQPTFTPYDLPPAILNRREMERALLAEYPPLLRDAEVGGTVKVWFFINSEGKVEQTRVMETSGHRQFDEAALRVADVIRFSPAQNRDKKVPVWVSLDITFEVR